MLRIHYIIVSNMLSFALLSTSLFQWIAFFIKMTLIWFLNAMCIFLHHIGHEWLVYDPWKEMHLKLCTDSYNMNIKKDFMSFDMWQLNSHIVTDIVSIYFFMNRVLCLLSVPLTRLGCFGVTAMLSWCWLKLRLRLIGVEVDWNWGWLKLK